jgi:hypothetical protein
MYLDEADLESLRTFNMQVDELYSTGLSSAAEAWYKNHTLELVKQDNDEWIVKGEFVPDNNMLKSFIMTYKTLTEKNNHCSLVKIAKVYDKLPDNLAGKMQFNSLRNDIKSYLYSDSGISKKGIHWKKETIVDYYINAIFAHKDLRKKEVVDEWTADKLSSPIYFAKFIDDLRFVADRFFSIKLINNSVLSDKSLHKIDLT